MGLIRHPDFQKSKFTYLFGGTREMYLSGTNHDDTFLAEIYSFVKTTSKKGFTSKQLKRVITCGALVSSVIGITPALARDNLIFESDFESRDTQDWALQDGKLPDATTVQSRVKRNGKHAVKLHMKRCSWMDPRCGPKPVKLSKPRAQMMNGKTRFHVDREYWIGASILIPEDWVSDSINFEDVFLQVHKNPDVNGPGTCEPGYYGTQPIQLDLRGTQWHFKHLKSNLNAKKFGDYVVRAELGPVSKGRWTDFIFNLKFAYGNDGFQKIWIDGKDVYNYTGSTICAGKDKSDKAANMAYLLVSLYKANWENSPHVETRTVYYDEIRVGNSSASYTDVAPGRQVDRSSAGVEDHDIQRSKVSQ